MDDRNMVIIFLNKRAFMESKQSVSKSCNNNQIIDVTLSTQLWQLFEYLQECNSLRYKYKIYQTAAYHYDIFQFTC